jgi:lysyl-tRNA synthetase class 2
VDIELLETRAEVLRVIRKFFDSRNYLAVDTPLLAPDLIPESCLEVFQTEYRPPGAAQPYWLIPSPEIWMKRLIAQHRRSLYQICACFRNGESVGHLHSPEFTMLEYYTMDANYLDSLSLTEELFRELLRTETAFGNGSAGTGAPVLRITMEEAFHRWAGIDLYRAAAQGGLAEEARRLGLDPPDDLDTAALYDLIFIHAVEPKLPRDVPVALMDYPAFVPCLAQKSADGKTVERWELYLRGVELANCYSEETDPGAVRRYFESEGKIKNETALIPHRIDENYWKVFDRFPRCSGVAMGLDRLIMIITRRSTIDGVLPFPMEAVNDNRHS